MERRRRLSVVLTWVARNAAALSTMLLAACADGSGGGTAAAEPSPAPAGAPTEVVGQAVILSAGGRSGWHSLDVDHPGGASCSVRREPTATETRASIAAVWWTRSGPPGARVRDSASFHWIELRDEAGTSVALFACALAETATAADVAIALFPAARLAD